MTLYHRSGLKLTHRKKHRWNGIDAGITKLPNGNVRKDCLIKNLAIKVVYNRNIHTVTCHFKEFPELAK